MIAIKKKLNTTEFLIIISVVLVILATISKILSNHPLLFISKEDLNYSKYVGYVALTENLNSTRQSYNRIEFKYDNNQKTAYIVCPNSDFSDASYKNCPTTKDLRELKTKNPNIFWYPVKIESMPINIPIIDFIVPDNMLTKKIELLKQD